MCISRGRGADLRGKIFPNVFPRGFKSVVYVITKMKKKNKTSHTLHAMHVTCIVLQGLEW